MSGLNAIADDPVIRCMERTGYPPWMRHHEPDEDDDEDYIGIGHSPCDSVWEEEYPEEHDDYYRYFEPVAVYEGEDHDDF